MNAAWFDAGGCIAPYVLQVEDDWREPINHCASVPLASSRLRATSQTQRMAGGSSIHPGPREHGRQQSLWSRSHLRRAIALLRHDAAVSGVRLKKDWASTAHLASALVSDLSIQPNPGGLYPTLVPLVLPVSVVAKSIKRVRDIAVMSARCLLGVCLVSARCLLACMRSGTSDG